MGLLTGSLGAACPRDVFSPLLLAVLIVDLLDDLRQGLARDLVREPLNLLQDKVGELETMDRLELDVHRIKPVPEIGFGHVVGNLPDAELFLVVFS